MTVPNPSTQAAARHARVSEAVQSLVAEQGYRVSMDAIAARAQCSKQTLYSRYGNKEALFRAVIGTHIEAATGRLDAAEPDLQACLTSFAIDHLEHLADPRCIAGGRLLIADALLFPDDASTIFRDSAGVLLERLALHLGDAAARGQLACDDPHMAAELLLGMIVGLDIERQRFGAPHRSTPVNRAAWACAAVGTFLRAFAPPANALRAPLPAPTATPRPGHAPVPALEAPHSQAGWTAAPSAWPDPLPAFSTKY